MKTKTISSAATLWQAPSCTLGESIIWDDRSRRFWWVDVPAGVLYRGEEGGCAPDRWQFPEALGHVALTENPDRVVLGFASGLELFDATTAMRTRLATVSHPAPGMRLNDGRCDRHGHLVFGTMSEGGKEPRGAFWWFGVGYGLRRLDLPAPAIPNSICFSPDGLLLYFTDSALKIIHVCDYEPLSGAVSGLRVFSDPGAVAWDPDGSCVDAAGGVWNACWGDGRIVRYHPGGALDLEIPCLAHQPTCPCLGGVNLDTLYASTAFAGLAADLRGDADGAIVSLPGYALQGLPEGRLAGL